MPHIRRSARTVHVRRGSTITFLVASVDERDAEYGDEVPAFTVCDEASGTGNTQNAKGLNADQQANTQLDQQLRAAKQENARLQRGGAAAGEARPYASAAQANNSVVLC